MARSIERREISTSAVYYYYAKAFDHVDHATVLRKMTAMGVPEFIVRWVFSFLSGRRQRVKIGNFLSDWLFLNGGMPQGTWLGLYVFLILINDLTAAIKLHKYVDDVTLTEVLAKDESSRMQTEFERVEQWSELNSMNINARKTKDMLLGHITQESRSTHDTQPWRSASRKSIVIQTAGRYYYRCTEMGGQHISNLLQSRQTTSFFTSSETIRNVC